jgi:hypothetical protein
MWAYAAEIVEFTPDVIVAHGNPFLAALREVNRTIRRSVVYRKPYPGLSNDRIG